MPPSEGEKHLRAEIRRRSRELGRMLLEWDVIGVYQGADGPDDDSEYDDLIWPIMGWLAEGVDAEELRVRLVRFLRSEYGLDHTDDSGGADFSQRVWLWWQASR